MTSQSDDGVSPELLRLRREHAIMREAIIDAISSAGQIPENTKELHIQELALEIVHTLSGALLP